MGLLEIVGKASVRQQAHALPQLPEGAGQEDPQEQARGQGEHHDHAAERGDHGRGEDPQAARVGCQGQGDAGSADALVLEDDGADALHAGRAVRRLDQLEEHAAPMVLDADRGDLLVLGEDAARLADAVFIKGPEGHGQYVGQIGGVFVGRGVDFTAHVFGAEVVSGRKEDEHDQCDQQNERNSHVLGQRPSCFSFLFRGRGARFAFHHPLRPCVTWGVQGTCGLYIIMARGTTVMGPRFRACS